MFLSTKKSFWFTKNKTIAINPSLILGAFLLTTKEIVQIDENTNQFHQRMNYLSSKK